MADAKKELRVQIPPVFFLYKDGSVERCPPGPLLPPSSEPGPEGVASKDLTLDAQLGLWARLFLPSLPPPPQKLPIVLYFHGGCFLFGGPAWSHSFCAGMAKRSSSIWVAASYRLAPEHRLPAAYEDGFSALRWLDAQAHLQVESKESLMDHWLARADFSKCFLAGASAGGCIAHHVAMRAMNPVSSLPGWKPALKIEGLILMHPGFGRENRTKEELEAPQDMMMSWALVDTCVELVGPAGVINRDHPYMNPLSEFSAMGGRFVLPRTLVAMADRDALHYMGLEYIQALQGAGCSVDSIMSRNVGHVFFSVQPESEQARTLFQKVSSFIAEQKGDRSASSK